jgi:hypothetical protein
LLKISGIVNASEVELDDDNELVLTLLLELSLACWAITSVEAIPKNRVVAKMAIMEIQK